MTIKFLRLLTSLLLVGAFALLATWPQTTLAQGTTTSRFSFSLVPPDCQDEDGCNICEVVKIFTNAATIIATVLSSVALLMFVIGGFMMIFSGGQPEKVERGKKVLIGTITGIGIVFLAWLAVNIIVRVSATSGKSSAGGVVATTKIFGKDWWNFNSCQPALPITCKGLSVGELCGGGECNANSKSAACSCYRPIDPSGDSSVCLDDATSADTATAKGQKCYCSAQCTRLKKKTNRDYTCISSKQAEKGYTEAVGISCADPEKVCALKN